MIAVRLVIGVISIFYVKLGAALSFLIFSSNIILAFGNYPCE